MKIKLLSSHLYFIYSNLSFARAALYRQDSCTNNKSKVVVKAAFQPAESLLKQYFFHPLKSTASIRNSNPEDEIDQLKIDTTEVINFKAK